MVTALGSMRNMELMGTSVFGDLVCPYVCYKTGNSLPRSDELER